jgi:hypothetical protein
MALISMRDMTSLLVDTPVRNLFELFLAATIALSEEIEVSIIKLMMSKNPIDKPEDRAGMEEITTEGTVASWDIKAGTEAPLADNLDTTPDAEYERHFA